jgi:HAD superfamily hydrolase (TIGR01509 family)
VAIRAVLCDLGGVVIRIDPDRIRSAWAELSDLTPGAVYRAYPDAVYDRFERDEVTEDEYLEHVRDTLSLRGTAEQIRAAFNDLYLGVDEDTVALLRRVKGRGVIMLALTNTNRTHHRVWSERFADALDLFDQVHCSHDLACRKPEPEVFRRVLEVHGLRAGEALFIDDVPGHVEAAEVAGLEAVVFTDAARLQRRLDALDWAHAGTS